MVSILVSNHHACTPYLLHGAVYLPAPPCARAVPQLRKTAEGEERALRVEALGPDAARARAPAVAVELVGARELPGTSTPLVEVRYQRGTGAEVGAGGLRLLHGLLRRRRCGMEARKEQPLRQGPALLAVRLSAATEALAARRAGTQPCSSTR